MKVLILIFAVVSLFAHNATIQLNWKYQFEFAGFIMAKEKGYYKEKGINITLKEVNKNTDVINTVLDTPKTYGVGDSSLISDVMIKNMPLKLLMPIYEESPYVLVAVNMNIKSLDEIKNSNVILDQFAIKNPAIMSMLKSENINIKNLNLKKENFYNNINQKGIFAFYKSNEIYILKKNHIKYKVFDPKDYGFDLYGDLLFTSKTTAKKYPKLTKNIIEATKKGYIYAFNHIDETINIILKKYNTQHFSKDKLLYEANVLKKYLSKTFKFNEKKLQKIENMYILLLF